MIKGASAEQAKVLDGSGQILKDDGLLVPIIPDDPYLRQSLYTSV